jgi:DNA-directed RNA polymerase specialized sigma54-like protein
MTNKPKALEVKLGHDLKLRQQLVMTPQLQQAIKILKLSLPALAAVVQNDRASRGGENKGR